MAFNFFGDVRIEGANTFDICIDNNNVQLFSAPQTIAQPDNAPFAEQPDAPVVDQHNVLVVEELIVPKPEYPAPPPAAAPELPAESAPERPAESAPDHPAEAAPEPAEAVPELPANAAVEVAPVFPAELAQQLLNELVMPGQNDNVIPAGGRPRRRVLPSLNEAPEYWHNIFTLPLRLRPVLSPNCDLQARHVTRYVIRQIIQHFNPDYVIHQAVTKKRLIELLDELVLKDYGVFYGIGVSW